MSTRNRVCGSWILAAAAFAAFGGLATAQPAQPAKAGAARKAAAREAGWPRRIQLGETTVLLDAPQAESLEGAKLKARGTARIQRSEGGEPAVATLWYDADVEINRARRIVTLASVSVPRLQLPGASPVKQQRLATRLGQVITRQRLALPLDDVLAGAKLSTRRDAAPPKLGTDPPKILFETEPAVLVVFDGAPRFRAVEGTSLERALNTPFLVLHDPKANAYWLDGGTMWFRAPDAAGPFSKADDVPREAVQIARRDLKDAGVADDEVEKAARSEEKRVPKILVATEPTELVVSDGPPEWRPEVEGELDAMSNSESDIFRMVSDKRTWLVLSGRWYRSDDLGGPWAYVSPDDVPAGFRRIRPESEKASVLAFVPGTAPAREALQDATTPRTAAVRRSEAHVTVTYDGEPKFERIPGGEVEYALNTAESVLRIRGRYLVCDQGVWFTADGPKGPWRVSDSIPDEDIQTIPLESPVYNTRFATVYDSTPDTVYVAYTPAYLGSYPYFGTVVFGTGWAYRPWWGAAYYPRPWTWGFHARYAPWAGWGYGFGWGPAWGGFRYGFGYGWGARWCGPGGFYRPAFRNVNVTRNVNVNRNVSVTRNLYASGANTARATTKQAAATKTAGAPKAATAPKAAAAKTSGANAKAGKTHPAKAKAGGKHAKEK
jgi:hypothetical protein